MADLKISALNSLAGADLVAADVVAVVDDSASETKKLTVSDLIANGTTLISDATIPSAKILFSAGSIDTAELAASAVETAKINDSAVTAAKLADNSSVTLVSALPASGSFVGQVAVDTTDDHLYVWDGSAWDSVKAAGSINVVNGSTTGEINIVASTSGDTVTISATLDDTTAAAQFLGGPTGAGGTVGYRALVGTDLPTATTSAKGGVIVNGNGLTMSGDTITIDNTVTAEATENHIVQYDANGLVTGGRAIVAGDVPVATSTTTGVVKPGSGLGVDAAGEISHSNAVTGATAAKVTFDAQGHITATEALAASDIPDLDTAKITTGTFPEERIGAAAVSGAKLKDYAVAQISETTPTADFTSQFFFNPITRDLFLWDGNVFQPVGISAGEIVLAGTYDASTNLLDSVTADGSAAGFTNGQSLPAADTGNNRYYVVVSQSGTGSAPAPTVTLEPPDILLSNGTSYVLIETSETITAQIASNVGFTPTGNIAGTNVQAAIAEVDSEKLAKGGDTMTGDLTLNNVNIVFEGATENDFETTLTVTDPTADRTITLPNVTGTVVTTGDTGSVTSTMITDGTIVNADISASAEIAVSKLGNGSARQVLQTDSLGTGVEFTDDLDLPGTLDVTGTATLDSALHVTGDTAMGHTSPSHKLDVRVNNTAAARIGGTAFAMEIGQLGSSSSPGFNAVGSSASMLFRIGGTEAMRIDPSRNVGIGTASPTRKLHVYDASTAYIQLTTAGSTQSASGGFQIVHNGAGDLRANLIQRENAPMTFSTNDTERMRIDSSGNVGINRTAPDNQLSIGSTASFHTDANSFYLGSNFTSTGSNFIGSSKHAQRLFFNNASGNGYLAYANTSSTGTAGNSITWEERLRIDSSGRVLIGTTTAYGSNDNVAIQKTDAGARIGLQHSTTGQVTAGEELGVITFYSNDGDLNPSASIVAAADLDHAAGDKPGRLVFSTTADGASSVTERMRIDSSGRVGIGTTSPDAPLHVVGNDGIAIQSSAQTNEFLIRPGSTSADGIRFTQAGGAGDRMAIDSSGRLLVGTTSAPGSAGSAPYALLQIEGNSFSGTGPGSIALRSGTASASIGDDGEVGQIAFAGNDNEEFALIKCDADAATGSGDHPGRLTFSTTADAASSPTERMRITSAGVVNSNNWSLNGQGTTTASSCYLGTFAPGSSAMAFATNGSERARIDSSGRVLVGTTAAAGGEILQASGVYPVCFVRASTSGGALINIKRTRGNLPNVYTAVQDGDNLGSIQWNGAYGSEYAVGATIEARADGQTWASGDCPGRLVFATTPDGSSSPVERVRISNNGQFSAFKAAGSSHFTFRCADTASSSAAFVLTQGATNNTNGTNAFIIAFNGNVTNTNNSYGAISDAKLKENIVDASSQWDDIKDLRVRNYNFIEGQTHTQIGVVAQEVETVSPGLVTESPDRDEEGNDLGTTTKSVNYSVLYMKAVKALQEAMDRIETLEAKVAALEAG